jgi:hypothetical protein
MAANHRTVTEYVVLASWCTQTKRWIELESRYASPGEAERSVTERGIYRVIVVGPGQRLPLSRLPACRVEQSESRWIESAAFFGPLAFLIQASRFSSISRRRTFRKMAPGWTC